MDGGSRRQIGVSGGGAMDNSILIDRMMLRFRPIAPKPPGSVDLPTGGKTMLVSVARKKRKYTRVRKRRPAGSKRNDPPESPVVTLQLLPKTERTEPREALGLGSRLPCDLNNHAIIAEAVTEKWGPVDTGRVGEEKKAVESWVTVERVTGTCMEAPALGRTDVERLMALEGDTCPGFVSDGRDRIRWVNGAYRRLVAGEEGGSPEVTAWLVRKEKLPHAQAFTCRVRLKYTWQEQQGMTKTLTAPCDVWKMDGGGLAWRLDINAALALKL